MKAMILKQAGSIGNLLLTEVPKPSIKEGEVLVKVRAISINPVDVNARAYDGVLNWIFGSERPVILGWDISGEVTAVAGNVTAYKIGDQVFGMVNFFGDGKAYAEYVAVPAGQLALKPDSVSHLEASAATLSAMTAYQALVEVAKIKKGDKVLIHAASGGVGHFAVQIAKHFGAYVIGTSSGKNKAFVLSLGADEHVDYTKEDFRKKLSGLDIVLDTIGGATLFDSLESVKENGVIVTLPSPEIPQQVIEKSKAGKLNLSFMMVQSKGETMQAIADMLQNQFLKSHIHKVFPFEEIAGAHLEVESKRVVGKVIVTIQN